MKNEKTTTEVPVTGEKRPLSLAEQIRESAARGQKIALTPIQKFIYFLQSHSVIGLAFGVIIADIVKQIVNVLVDGLIRPLIGLFLPAGNQQFAPLNIQVRGVVFKFGDVISIILQTFIIFVILYLVLGWILKKEDILGTDPAAKQKSAKKLLAKKKKK